MNKIFTVAAVTSASLAFDLNMSQLDAAPAEFELDEDARYAWACLEKCYDPNYANWTESEKEAYFSCLAECSEQIPQQKICDKMYAAFWDYRKACRHWKEDEANSYREWWWFQ